MLYDYLLTHYNPNEPIFIEDITLSNTRTDLLQKLKALCDTGKIKIFSNGVYYIPKESMLKTGELYHQLLSSLINILRGLERL